MNWTAVSLLVLVSLGCGATGREALAQSDPYPPPLPMDGFRPPPPSPSIEQSPPLATPADAQPVDPWRDPMATLRAEMERGSPGPRRVLEAARAMLDEGVVARGSCYTWVNAVFRRAGGRVRVTFHGDRRTPFASASQMQPGDWVQFVNHSHGDVTHSAIFVAWIEEGARRALMASYPGGNRDQPGRFGEYELTNAYRLMRMSDPEATAPPPRAERRAERRARRGR